MVRVSDTLSQVQGRIGSYSQRLKIQGFDYVVGNMIRFYVLEMYTSQEEAIYKTILSS